LYELTHVGVLSAWLKSRSVHDLSQSELTYIELCYKNKTTPYEFPKRHCCDFLQA